jgi:hypothetical protein
MGIIDVKGIEPIPLFFQSGYLTVKSVNYKNRQKVYSFKIPNKEIGEEFYKLFSKGLAKFLNFEPADKVGELAKAILLHDSEILTKYIQSLFKSIPQKKHKINHNEYFFTLCYMATYLILPKDPQWNPKAPR